jgi:hypothetical protein
VSLLLNVGLIFAFDRWLDNGAVAVGVVRILTECVMIGGAIILLPSGTIDRATLSMSARIVVTSACLALVTSALLVTSLIVAIVAGAAVFVGAAFALRVLRLQDLTLARAIVRDQVQRRMGGSAA